VDLGVGDPGVVVDHGVDECLAGRRVAGTVRQAGAGGGDRFMPVTLLTSDVAVAATVGDVAELF
jgi:hypothetical protein